VAQAAAGGGGGSLIARLDPLFTEIADLLGQLAGNEAAWRVFDSEQNRTLSDGWMLEHGYFTIPGDYGFDTPALFVAMHPMHPDFNGSEVNNAQREQLLQEAVNDVWHQARDQWSAGAVSAVYRSLTRNVWEPDAVAAIDAAQTFYETRVWLDEEHADDGWVRGGEDGAPPWLTNLAVHWPATSQGANSFQDFWDDVNDKVAHYLLMAARLSVTATQVAVTLSDFQTNLLDITERARDSLREALRQWQTWKDDSGAWPTGEMVDGGVRAMLGGVSYVSGLGSLAALGAPPLSITLGITSSVAGTLSYIVPEQQVMDMEATKAVISSEVHQGLLNDLGTCAENMTTALDGIHTTPLDEQGDLDSSPSGARAFDAYVVDAAGQHDDWAPDPVNL